MGNSCVWWVNYRRARYHYFLIQTLISITAKKKHEAWFNKQDSNFVPRVGQPKPKKKKKKKKVASKNEEENKEEEVEEEGEEEEEDPYDNALVKRVGYF